MIRTALLLASLIAGCVSRDAVGPVAASPAASSAARFYMLARLDVQDFARFRSEYASKVLPMLQRAGARILVASPSVELREGTWDANWTVILEFASRPDAMGFYEAAEYQPLKQLRLSLIRSGSLLFVEGVTPPANAAGKGP